jgi:RNA polymerase sigma-70 factor (ECF subfamily)
MRGLGQPNVRLARSSNAVRTAVAEMPSYDALDRAHRDRVTRLCRVLLADDDDAADAVQDVFTKLHRSLATETRPMDWSAWLTRVAVNACRDRRRTGWWRWWHERGVEIDERRLRTVRTPEDEVVGRETQRRIWTAYRALPPRQREVFALRQIDGRSTADVAAMLGLGEGTVKRHLFRAVHALRAALREPS